MKQRILSFSTLLFLTCVLNHALGGVEIPTGYQLDGYHEFSSLKEATAYKKGVAMARHDFERGMYRMLVFGKRPINETEDEKRLRETQSIYFVPIAGCMVDDGIVGAAHGYNKTMRDLLEERYGRGIFGGVQEGVTPGTPTPL